jgi:hypothetical protein
MFSKPWWIAACNFTKKTEVKSTFKLHGLDGIHLSMQLTDWLLVEAAVTWPISVLGPHSQRDSIYDRNIKTGALLIAKIHGYLLGLKSIKTLIVGLKKIYISPILNIILH